MRLLQIRSASEQVADHLREELIRGTWTEFMPGESKLLSMIGAGRDTIKAALAQLEQEGILVSQGQGRRRRIELPKGPCTPSLRIAILDHNPILDEVDFVIRDLLEQAHHTVISLPKTLTELKMNPKRIGRLVEQTDAGAWIVKSASREVLEWFIDEEIPVFSLFGFLLTLPVAGAYVDHSECIRKLVHRLVNLGHQRIVMLSRRGKKEGGLGLVEKVFLAELETLGLTVGSFNLPAWEDSPEGFRKCLDSLFSHTPPTAIIIEEAPYFWATMQFMGTRGYQVPQDVSLICSENARSFSLSSPPICHNRWEISAIVRRMIRWADNIAHGKKDLKQTRSEVEFVEGGTIGPPPKK